MIDKDAIAYRHWSLKVGRLDPATGVAPDVFGDIVVSVDDLDQSIANIVLTPKGSVPTEPEKGCDILGAIDKHPSIGIPLLTREIWDALTIWEPRIVLQDVKVAMPEFSRFSTSVFWRPIASVIQETRVTEIAYNG